MTDRLTLHGLLDAATSAADRIGYNKITRQDIAAAAGCSEASVSHYLGTMEEARGLILNYALLKRFPSIVAQGIIMRDPATDHLSHAEKTEVFNTFLSEE